MDVVHNSNASDVQSTGASGTVHDMDSHKLIINDCSDNGQLGCSGMGLDTNTADYMSDAFGELCLDSLGCANDTAGDAFTALDQNVTHLLTGQDDDSFMHYCMNRADNISYLNISCEFELEYATPLYGICVPILLFVTVTANLLIVIVLSRRSMATPTNSVLMGESRACGGSVGGTVE